MTKSEFRKEINFKFNTILFLNFKTKGKMRRTINNIFENIKNTKKAK